MKKWEGDTKVVVGVVPQTLGGAPVDKWVSLENYDSLTVIYVSDVGTAGSDPVLKVRQAKTAGGGSAKNVTGIEWLSTQGVAIGEQVKRTVADSLTDVGETECLAWAEITADMLDNVNGYNYAGIDVTAGGNTKIGAAILLLRGARYQGDPIHSKGATS